MPAERNIYMHPFWGFHQIFLNANKCCLWLQVYLVKIIFLGRPPDGGNRFSRKFYFENAVQNIICIFLNLFYHKNEIESKREILKKIKINCFLNTRRVYNTRYVHKPCLCQFQKGSYFYYDNLFMDLLSCWEQGILLTYITKTKFSNWFFLWKKKNLAINLAILMDKLAVLGYFVKKTWL